MSKVKLYPSSLGFTHGDLATITTQDHCLRYAQLSYQVRRPEIHQAYKLLGAHHEAYIQRKYPDAKPEERISEDFGGGIVSGRRDFVMPNGEILETKASYNKQKVAKAMSGTPQEGHLAQLVIYQVMDSQPVGRIIYAYYGQPGKISANPEMLADLRVTFDDDEVLIDGHMTAYRVSDLVQHIIEKVEAISSDELRPMALPRSTWQNPCTLCPLKNLCETELKSGRYNVQGARELARPLIENQPTYKPKGVE